MGRRKYLNGKARTGIKATERSEIHEELREPTLQQIPLRLHHVSSPEDNLYFKIHRLSLKYDIPHKEIGYILDLLELLKDANPSLKSSLRFHKTYAKGSLGLTEEYMELQGKYPELRDFKFLSGVMEPYNVSLEEVEQFMKILKHPEKCKLTPGSALYSFVSGLEDKIFNRKTPEIPLNATSSIETHEGIPVQSLIK